MQQAGLSSADLSRRFFVTPQTMNQIVAGMARRGLIVIALGGLALGSATPFSGRSEHARWIYRRLADAGVECVVLERDALPQGSTALSSGFIPAAGTAVMVSKVSPRASTL